ncbi:MAG: HIT family protein [Lachnospiraceae bacterium]
MNENCAYCAEGDRLDKFGIKICELPASKIILFKEQSHKGRLIVASKLHVDEICDLNEEERKAFIDDVAHAATAIRKAFGPDKINYGAYGDTMHHLHFHLVPKYHEDEFEWGTTFAMDPKRKTLSEGEYSEIINELKKYL